MQIEFETVLSTAPEAILERLHAVEHWPTWLPGLASVEVARPGKHAEVLLCFDTPRRIELRMEVDSQHDGIFCVLIEGDVAGVQAEVRVATEGEGTRLRWHLYLQFQTSIPGTILTELETEVLPRWSRALD